MSTSLSSRSPAAAAELLREHGRTAGAGALTAGLGHVLFAAGGAVAGLGAAALQSYDYAAGAVAEYRWFGIVGSLLAIVWALAYTFGMLALGRLVWRAGTLAAALAATGAVTVGTLIALTSGLDLALFSGATTDLAETGAAIAAQQAAMQGVWVVLHGAWYAATWIIVGWLVAYAIAAYRRRIFRVLGVVLTLLAAATAVIIVFLTAYPTSLPFISLLFIVLGVTLLVRTRRAVSLRTPSAA